MTKAKSIVHSTNISSIDYKITDFFSTPPTFEEKVEQELNNHATILKRDDRIHMVDKNHFKYYNPICPKCNSSKYILDGYRKINPVLPVIGKTELFIQRYECKICGRRYQTSLKKLISPKNTISDEIKENIRKSAENGYKSLRNIANDLKIHSNIPISHQTVKNILSIETNDEIKNEMPEFSGHYAYDEQFLGSKRHRTYRLLLYDTSYDFPIAEKIVKTRSKTAIKRFIEDNLKNQPKISIVTDHFKMYRKLMTEIGFKHQLCIFHLLQNLNKKHKKFLKSKKVSSDEKIKSCIYMSELKEIFHSWTMDEAKNKLKQIIKILNSLPEFLREIINKKIIPDFDKLTMFLEDRLIHKTSNCCERYFSKTLPKQNKKRFKSNKGVLSYLHPYMKKQIQIFKKKFYYTQPPDF
jgi:transposase-like protein